LAGTGARWSVSSKMAAFTGVTANTMTTTTCKKRSFKLKLFTEHTYGIASRPLG